MSVDADDGEATTQVTATLLLVAITLLLALLLFLLFRFPALSWTATEPPVVFAIGFVGHTDELHPGVLNYDSRIVLRHTGTDAFDNQALSAEIFVNGARLPCRIETMNGHDFISTHHTGVQRMWGSGCSSTLWNPGEQTGMDLSDGMIHPGDTLRVDILHRPTGAVISRDTCIA